MKKSEHLYRAIGGISEKTINDAVGYTAEKKRGAPGAVLEAVAVAAVVCGFIALSVVLARISGQRNDSVGTGINTEADSKTTAQLPAYVPPYSLPTYDEVKNDPRYKDILPEYDPGEFRIYRIYKLEFDSVQDRFAKEYPNGNKYEYDPDNLEIYYFDSRVPDLSEEDYDYQNTDLSEFTKINIRATGGSGVQYVITFYNADDPYSVSPQDLTEDLVSENTVQYGTASVCEISVDYGNIKARYRFRVPVQRQTEFSPREILGIITSSDYYKNY